VQRPFLDFKLAIWAFWGLEIFWWTRLFWLGIFLVVLGRIYFSFNYKPKFYADRKDHFYVTAWAVHHGNDSENNIGGGNAPNLTGGQIPNFNGRQSMFYFLFGPANTGPYSSGLE